MYFVRNTSRFLSYIEECCETTVVCSSLCILFFPLSVYLCIQEGMSKRSISATEAAAFAFVAVAAAAFAARCIAASAAAVAAAETGKGKKVSF